MNPDFFESHFTESHFFKIPIISNLDLPHFPLRYFEELQNPEIWGFQGYKDPGIPGMKGFQGFRNSRDLGIPRIQEFQGFRLEWMESLVRPRPPPHPHTISGVVFPIFLLFRPKSHISRDPLSRSPGISSHHFPVFPPPADLGAAEFRLLPFPAAPTPNKTGSSSWEFSEPSRGGLVKD